MTEIIYKSKIKCPYCGFDKEVEMPSDRCVYFYVCTNCNKIIKPEDGDYCVFCSYGTVKCPPIQKNQKC